MGSAFGLGLRFGFPRLIGAHDAAHQGMAHDIGIGEAHDADAVDAGERIDRILQARALAERQVDLATDRR